MNLSLTKLPKTVRSLVVVFADALVLPVALWSAVALRQGQWQLDPAPPAWIYAMAVLVTLPIFLRLGLYRAVVRYFETRAFAAVIGAAAVSALLFSVLVLLIDRQAVPVTALIIYGLLSAGYAALTRLIARQILRREVPRNDMIPVAVYGAGAAGRQVVQGLRQGTDYRPVFLVDDNPSLHGRSVLGLSVYAGRQLAEMAERHDLGMVIVAIPSMTPGQRSDLLKRLGDLNTEVRLIPGMADMVRGTADLAELREVRPEDLLGRDAVTWT